jgi:hypothetical protein
MNIALQLEPIAAIADVVRGASLTTFNVGPDGAIYLVIADDESDPHRTYRVVGMRGEEIVVDLRIYDVSFNINYVQPLGSDILLVDARCPRGTELNGHVYNSDGVLIRSIGLGDGIEMVQATSRGELWTSYFDEGVFGGPGAIGGSGLVAWTGLGERLYEFDPEGKADPIDDCYALNVESDDDVWCYYYSAFPLVHLHKHQIVSVHTIPVSSCDAFAVAGAHVLFNGDDRRRRRKGIFHLVGLTTDGAARIVATIQARDKEGQFIEVERTIGRAGSLYFQSGRQIFQFSVEQALATLEF